MAKYTILGRLLKKNGHSTTPLNGVGAVAAAAEGLPFPVTYLSKDGYEVFTSKGEAILVATVMAAAAQSIDLHLSVCVVDMDGEELVPVFSDSRITHEAVAEDLLALATYVEGYNPITYTPPSDPSLN